MYYFFRTYPISITTAIVILYLSFFTPPETQAAEIPFFDKIVHFCMYGGITSFLWLEHYWHHHTIHWKHLRIGGILCPILMSGLIEIGQSTLTDNRSGEWMDFVANTLGVLTASVVWFYTFRFFNRKRKS